MIETTSLLRETAAGARMPLWRRKLDDVLTELLEGDGDERERLAKAAASFRIALTAYQSWPAAPRAASDALRAKLVAGGRFEATVAGLSEERLREVSDELRRFCHDSLAGRGVQTGEREGALDGIDKLREAKALLVGDGLDRAALRAAARRFWSAEFHCETWPPGLRASTEALIAKIFRHGPIDAAVSRMSVESAEEIKRDLIRLCDEAERLVEAADGREAEQVVNAPTAG